MIGRRQIRPPTQADASFVLVEFTEDGEFEIYTEDKVKKTGLGLFLAPYGPHKVDYPCRIIQFSTNKAQLIRIKNEYAEFGKKRPEYLSCVKNDEFTNNKGKRDNGHNKGNGDNGDVTYISDGKIEEVQKTKKNLQEHTEGKKEKGDIPIQKKGKQLRMSEQKQNKIADQQRKPEEKHKKKEGKQNKQTKVLRMEEEKKKKEEQQRKKEERQLKKKEQEQKKEEKQKRKEAQEKAKALLLQRNQSIMQQMADFEEPDIWDLDSTQQEPRYDHFTTDVVDESVSLISSCQQMMHSGEVPSVQNVQRPRVKQNSNKKPHPTIGKKCPRKQFMPETAFGILSEDPDAKRLTTPTSGTHTDYSKSQLPGVCSNCTGLLKELEDARYQIQSLKEKLEDDSFNGKSTEGVSHVMTNPRAGKVSKSVADLYQMVELVPGTRIYVYQNQLDKAMTRETATARARCIIMAFYTPEELLKAANLSGANEKKGLDPDIVDAVIGFSVQQFGDTKKNRNDVKASLRRKLSAMSSDEKKRHQDSEQLEMKPAKKAKKWSNLNGLFQKIAVPPIKEL